MLKILKNGKVVLPNKTINADVMIDNEKIVKIDENITNENAQIFDCTGSYILAGGIDSHTHCEMDAGVCMTADNFSSSSRAAIQGGTTTVIDFCDHIKGESLNKTLDDWHKLADGKSYCDYSFHMGISFLSDKILNEMEDIVKKGIPSFKIYLAYDSKLDDSSVYKVLKKSKELDAIVACHCENGDVIETLREDFILNNCKSPYYHPKSRPSILEAEAVNRFLSLAKLTNAKPWIVHLSSKEAYDIVEKFRSQGLDIIVETCPQYLVLNDDVYGEKLSNDFDSAKYVCSPPIRKNFEQKALWDAIIDNKIDFISTDHCSFNFKGQKDLGKDDFTKIPNGLPGIGERFILFYSNAIEKMSINKITKVLSYNPAKILGLKGKGIIKEGYDADLLILNPNKTTIIDSNKSESLVDYSAYEGFKLNGKIEKVFSRGNLAVDDSKIVLDNPIGKFQKRYL